MSHTICLYRAARGSSSIGVCCHLFTARDLLFFGCDTKRLCDWLGFKTGAAAILDVMLEKVCIENAGLAALNLILVSFE